MSYLAIIAEQGGKIAKFAPFDTQAEADTHVAQYGGFVHQTNVAPEYVNVDWLAQTATDMSQAEIDATKAVELDAVKDREAANEVDKILGDIQRRALNVLFDTINTVRTNAGQQPITLQQYVNALNGAGGPITREQFVSYVKGKL